MARIKSHLFGILSLLLLGFGTPLAAQELGQIISPVLIVDREKMFTDSTFGRAISAELAKTGTALEVETRNIVESLEEEELALSMARSSLSSEEFRARADAFDARVQVLREEREVAEEQHRLKIERAGVEFLQQVNPILAAMMQEAGAVILLDPRVVVISVKSIDITDTAIARIDAIFAQGGIEIPEIALPEPVAPTE